MGWELVGDVLKNALLVTGLVMVMMMTIEYINVRSAGKWFGSLRNSKVKQVLLGALLGLIPGCVGGFAAVSLFSHGLISLGALVAAMIASSGDEAFVMLAMIPKTAVILFGVLFVIAFVSGMLVDKFYRRPVAISCDQEFEVHHEHSENGAERGKKGISAAKVLVVAGLALFAAALFTGALEHTHHHPEQVSETLDGGHHEHGEGHHDHHQDEACHLEHHSHDAHQHGAISLLDERWINILFGVISVVVLFLILNSSEHFVQEHIWNHVIKKHCLKIFLWTFGALAVIQVGLHYLDIEHWLSENVFVVILIAALVGMIPESGPHMVFITLFATGYVPFSVLLASSISQDGHTALPLLASDKQNFLRTKLVNALVAVVCGGVLMLFGL